MSGATLWEEPQDPREAASPSGAQGFPGMISGKHRTPSRVPLALLLTPSLLLAPKVLLSAWWTALSGCSLQADVHHTRELVETQAYHPVLFLLISALNDHPHEVIATS